MSIFEKLRSFKQLKHQEEGVYLTIGECQEIQRELDQLQKEWDILVDELENHRNNYHHYNQIPSIDGEKK